MKKIFLGMLLLFTTSIFPATIRIYNMLGNADAIVTIITSQKRVTEHIAPKQSILFNSWVSTINGFEWEIKGTYWTAPLEVMPLQTEGRLYIHQHGKYTFKPCFPCKDTHGQAKQLSQPTRINQNIPTPPPLPSAPNTPKDQESSLLEEIKAGKNQLSPAQDRELGPKPDTRTSRDKLLEDIQKGTTLKKVDEPAQKKPQHEMLNPLSKAIDERRQQLEQLQGEENQETNEDEWQD